MMRVKICGMTREVDIGFAVLAGADAVGFIVGFPASPRCLSLDVAGQLAKTVPPFVDAVLVTTAEVLGANPDLKGARFDSIQVYGDLPDPEAVRKTTGAKLIRAYPAKTDDKETARRAANGYDAILLDTYSEGQDGGTGTPADWTVCRNIKYAVAPTRVILSGGLTPANVAAAINSVRPFAVDVSSGVESAPGVKDPGKVMEFIKKAKVADW